MSEERFPGVIWTCARCHDILNDQPNFNDHKYIWKCTNCGYKTSISKDNIPILEEPTATAIVKVSFAQVFSVIQQCFLVSAIFYFISVSLAYYLRGKNIFSLIPSIKLTSVVDLILTLMHISVYIYLVLLIISVFLKKKTRAFGDNETKSIVNILLTDFLDGIIEFVLTPFKFLFRLVSLPYSIIKKDFFPSFKQLLYYSLYTLIILIMLYGILYEYSSIHLPVIPIIRMH